MRNLLVFGLGILGVLGVSVSSASAQPRGSIELIQSSPLCNVDSVSDGDSDDDDLINPENAGCAVTAIVRNPQGRPINRVQVQLFQQPLENWDAQPIDANYSPFSSPPRTTGRGGTATFTFQSPQDGEICYQARSRSLSLKSNSLCITSDSTISTDANGNETVVADVD